MSHDAAEAWRNYPLLVGVTSRIEEAVATITLDRPEKHNAQTPHTWSALVDLAEHLPATVRVVVLRGTGRSFSAGMDRAMFSPAGVDGAPDIHAMAAGTEAQVCDLIALWQRAFDWISRPNIISIAAVQGHAIGGGFQLALGADIRIVAADASFKMAEPTLGIVPDMGGTKRLVDLVGYSRAADICLTGRIVDADEALRIGIASRVVPVADLERAVARTVEAILTIEHDASTATKALLLGAAARTQQEQQVAEQKAQYQRLRALALIVER